MKRAKAIAAAVGAALLLSSCGGGSTSSDDSASDGPIVVYTNSDSDGRGDWLTDQAKGAGFDIQIVGLGGGDLTNRLLVEKNNPQADVVFGLNNVYFQQLVDDDVLEPFTPEWSSEVDGEAGDGEHYWPIVREPIMGVFSLKAYPDGKGAPTDWPDLWEKEQYHDRYMNPSNLAAATPQMVLAGIFSRYRDDDGHLGISDEGWTAIEEFFKYGKTPTEGRTLYAEFADDSAAIGPMSLANKHAQEEQFGVPSRAMTPEIGVPMVYQHTGLVAGTQNKTKSEEFIDWFGSAPIQAEWSKKFFTAPTNEAALPDANAEAVKETDAFKEQDIDWGWVTENLDQWIEEIELKYVQS